MKTMSLCLWVLAALALSGCATQDADPCMSKLGEYARQGAAAASKPDYEAKLPQAVGLFADAEFSNARWVLVSGQEAGSLTPPGQVIYAVVLPRKSDSAQQGGSNGCDFERTYLVVSGGSFGNPKRAFGPLSMER